MAELTYGNYDYIRAPARRHRADRRAARLPARRASTSRRDGFYDVVNAAGGTESRGQRPRPLLRPRPVAVRAERRALDPPDRRLYRRARNPAAAPSMSDRARRSIRRPASRAISPYASRATAARRRQPHRRRADRASAARFPSRGDPYNRDISRHAGPHLSRARPRDWGVSAQVDWDLGGATLTSITAYRDYKSDQPVATSTIAMSTSCCRDDDGNAFRDFQTFTQELRLQGSAFGGVLDWLVGGYYANEDLHVRDNLRFGSQYGAFAACRLVATVNPARRCATRPRRAASAPTGRATAQPARSAPAAPAHPRRPRPAEHGQQCRRQRRQLFPGQPQLGDLHPQHLQHHRRARA